MTIGLRTVMTICAVALVDAMPSNRTSIGTALNDTAQEVGTSVGTAVVGTMIAVLVTTQLPAGTWSSDLVASFFHGERITYAVLAVSSAWSPAAARSPSPTRARPRSIPRRNSRSNSSADHAQLTTIGPALLRGSASRAGPTRVASQGKSVVERIAMSPWQATTTSPRRGRQGGQAATDPTTDPTARIGAGAASAGGPRRHPGGHVDGGRRSKQHKRVLR